MKFRKFPCFCLFAHFVQKDGGGVFTINSHYHIQCDSTWCEKQCRTFFQPIFHDRHTFSMFGSICVPSFIKTYLLISRCFIIDMVVLQCGDCLRVMFFHENKYKMFFKIKNWYRHNTEIHLNRIMFSFFWGKFFHRLLKKAYNRIKSSKYDQNLQMDFPGKNLITVSINFNSATILLRNCA